MIKRFHAASLQVPPVAVDIPENRALIVARSVVTLTLPASGSGTGGQFLASLVPEHPRIGPCHQVFKTFRAT
jgi:hypothetical protein